MRFRALQLALLFAFHAGAQPVPPTSPPPENPVLTFTGKPITVPFRCTDDDIAWAGLACSPEEPCTVYLELTAADSIGDRIVAIGNIHSATVTLYSIVLTSEDGGHTWREGHPRLRGAGLDRVQFIDFETGWISGQQLTPLPQDPFLLITHDGGRTWRQHNFFEDPHMGSILQIWFTAKSSGQLVFDHGSGAEGNRYELYESPNAGDTWMLREASDKPIPLKHGPPPVPAWRIHPDAATKSFRIEHQVESGRWSSVASFLVPLHPCLPEPAKPEQAPAAEPAPAVPPRAQPSPPRKKRG